MPHDFDDDFPELTDEQALAREEEMKSRQEFREWRKKYLELPADEQKWLSEQPKLVQDYYYAMPLKRRGLEIRDAMRYERREKEHQEFMERSKQKREPEKMDVSNDIPSTDLEDFDFAIDKFAFETTWAQPELRDIAPEDLGWLPKEYQEQLRQWGQRENVIGNPPAWVAEPKKWARAKKIMKPYFKKSKTPYALVAKLYAGNFKGKIKHKKKS